MKNEMINEAIQFNSNDAVDICRDDFYSLVKSMQAHGFSVEKPLKDCIYPKVKMAEFQGRLDFLEEQFWMTELPSVYDFAEELAEEWASNNDGTKEEYLEWFKEAFFFDYDTLLDRK
jgi:hypothetical protein